MKIIAFCGLTQSGKDTAAEGLYELGYTKSSFAQKLKEVIADVYQVPIEWMNDTILKNTPCKELWGKTPRDILQPVATEGFREGGHPDTWVNYLHAKLAMQEKYKNLESEFFLSITDIRFPNEARMLRDIGASLVWIRNPHAIAGTHASESQVESVGKEFADFTIDNDKTLLTIPELHATVQNIAAKVKSVDLTKYDPFKNITARSIYDRE